MKLNKSWDILSHRKIDYPCLVKGLGHCLPCTWLFHKNSWYSYFLFFSYERWDMGYSIWNMGYAIWDMGHGTWNQPSLQPPAIFEPISSHEEYLYQFLFRHQGCYWDLNTFSICDTQRCLVPWRTTDSNMKMHRSEKKNLLWIPNA